MTFSTTKSKEITAVHGMQLLHKLISKSCPTIHVNRLSCLMYATEGLLEGNKLTLVNIGRNIPGTARVKNKIKRCDRLLGNSHLLDEKILIYQALTKAIISPASRPIILIDWSGATPCGAFHMIRASIPINGRSLTIYEEVYPENKKDSPKSNKIFLKNLARILPLDCSPIIVTDAGFRNPWFKEILKMGWDYVGRVRNSTKAKEITKNTWDACKDLYKKATLKAQFLGEFWLAKTNQLLCRMFIIKEKKKYRKKKNLKGHRVRCSSSLKHAKRNKEPWLIATSLPAYSAKKIIKIYKLRMCIEQGFRDIKNQRNGFSFEETRSMSSKRLSILLLIGALATFTVCIYGHTCVMLNMQYQFQTNSTKHRTVLSWFFLGVFVIKKKIKLKTTMIQEALDNISLGGHYYE